MKGLEIIKGVCGENHPATAISYNNIALISAKQEDYETALKYNFKTLEITLYLFGENHSKTAVSYNNIGLVMSEIVEFEKL